MLGMCKHVMSTLTGFREPQKVRKKKKPPNERRRRLPLRLPLWLFLGRLPLWLFLRRLPLRLFLRRLPLRLFLRLLATAVLYESD
jgi:type VI protein secretion system component VasF